MTTIAYQNGKLYADTRAYSGDKTPIGRKDKIHRLKNGIFAATSVNVGASERIVQILQKDGVLAEMPTDLNADAFFVEVTLNDFNPNEKKVVLWGYFDGPAWVKLDHTDTLFIGSGAHFAMGAYAAVGDVEVAMQVACDLDIWTGGPLQVVEA